ncbi:hypothetical protein VTK73DRAFT_9542 [Phialemonium thermophilum]|uniref:PLC-like phosphodiesterase n=1 Tax=Phialemonium thermophilum TaxID=223376 RepID=A0ABR3XK71_9PEZI
MPSKGIQCYTYIAVPGCSIQLSVPKQTIVKNELRTFWNGDLEVDAKNISAFFCKTGRFRFKVLLGGKILTEQWLDVNAVTGRIGKGTMRTIADTPSILHTQNLVVSYGFYAAGDGEAGLPDRHQCYVTVVPNSAAWMGVLAPPGSTFENQPLSRLVLPAPHDVGMNSMTNCNLVLARVGGAVVSKLIGNDKTVRAIVDAISGRAIELIAPDIIYSLAITQKDSLGTMLQLGARYFEFRPAHCHRDILPDLPIPDVLYFQHGAIPGMAYQEFLDDVVDFLVAHPTEIAVVQLRWDGVSDACQHPTAQELDACLSTALARSKGQLSSVGTLDDLINRHATIGRLRQSGKRLVLLNSVANGFSTYTDEGNATLDGSGIIAEFNNLLAHPEQARGRPLVVLQCQATASNVSKAVAYSVLSASASTSCLLATKALCDAQTLPWLREHGVVASGPDALVVVMNDFFDGATADVAIGLSTQRIQEN